MRWLLRNKRNYFIFLCRYSKKNLSIHILRILQSTSSSSLQTNYYKRITPNSHLKTSWKVLSFLFLFLKWIFYLVKYKLLPRDLNKIYFALIKLPSRFLQPLNDLSEIGLKIANWLLRDSVNFSYNYWLWKTQIKFNS